jgi:uncharacterized membrane protein
MTRADFSFYGFPCIAMTIAWLVVCLCIIAAPILVSHACLVSASVLYLLFSGICHQIPERSFLLLGYPLAVCQRCFGIYVGLLIGGGLAIRWMHQSARRRRFWVLCAVFPMALDGFVSLAGIWSGTALSRWSTGLIFGALISSLVLHGVIEFVREAPWRRVATSLHYKGDLS